MAVDFRGLQERLRQRLLVQIAARELTGVQLAEETGFQQAHISNFLNRKRGLSLEAMDAILAARKLTLKELLAGPETLRSRRRSLHANATGVTYIPVVETKNCLASELPYSAAKNALQVMSVRLEKLRARMHTPRPHWQRFVAMRVSAAEAIAMAPRLARGALVVIDRHSNTGDSPRSIYLVHAGQQFVLRHVERMGTKIVLRAVNPDVPLLTLESASGGDPLTAIVGRVCLTISEV